MRASDLSPRMFESDFVDFFSRTPWWTVPVIWVPVSLGLFAWGLWGVDTALWQAVALFGAGWFFWTFTEYSLHRTVFHWKPSHPLGQRFHFIAHGVHHEWHFDRYRLVMPPAVSLSLSVVFGALFWFVAGPEWFFASYAGFLWGYLTYDVVHYATHHLKFRGAWFQALKKHHLLHHHSPKHKDRKYGVSTRFWDRVFGTL